MSIKGDDVLDAHGLQLLQSERAVEALAVVAAVLAAAEEDRHDYAQTVRLAAGRLDETLEILEMIVRAHAVLLAEHVVLAAVVSHVDEKIKIHPTDGILDQALAVAGLKAGAFAINDLSLIHI